MGIEDYYYQLGEAPEKPALDVNSEDAKSSAMLEEALNGFIVAYRHGTTAYLLRKKDDENGPIIRPPEGMVFADRAMTGGATNTACKYAGEGYLYVDASEGTAIIEEVESYISGRLQQVLTTARSFSIQDPSSIGDVYEEMYSFHELLLARMPTDDSSLDVVDLRDHISVEYWEEELARLFREKVANQIPGVFSRQYNTAVLLCSQLKAYMEILESSWQSIYKVLEAGIDAFFKLAVVSEPEANMTLLQIIEIVGPALKSSFSNLAAPIDTATAAAEVISSTETPESIGGSTAADLRESVDKRLSDIIREADQRFDELGEELSKLSGTLDDLALYELTLPEIDSIF